VGVVGANGCTNVVLSGNETFLIFGPRWLRAVLLFFFWCFWTSSGRLTVHVFYLLFYIGMLLFTGVLSIPNNTTGYNTTSVEATRLHLNKKPENSATLTLCYKAERRGFDSR
jgi:hypothetical protein